jgi:hypothetical protein
LQLLKSVPIKKTLSHFQWQKLLTIWFPWEKKADPTNLLRPLPPWTVAAV